MSPQEIARTLEMSEYLVKEYIAIIEEYNKMEDKLMMVQSRNQRGVICRHLRNLHVDPFVIG
jgi:DNA-binding CsgD family transcriptional regulator